MRVLLIPLDYHRHNEDERFFNDMLREFNANGNSAIIYNGNDNTAIEFKPDHIFYQGSLTVDKLAYLKYKTNATVILWTGDARYVPSKYLIEFKNVVDLYLLPFSGDTLSIYRKILKKPCRFIFEPIQDFRFKQPKQLDSGNITFIGNLYNNLPGCKERIDLLNFIPGITVYGSGYGNNITQVNNFDVPEIYNNSFAVICENNIHNLENYFTPRNLMAMAAGSCSLMKVFPGIESHFINLEHCIYYRDKYELLDIVDFLKANPEIRNKLAVSGYEYVKENYSMTNFVNNLINKICEY